LAEVRVAFRNAGFSRSARLARTPRRRPLFRSPTSKKILSRIARKQGEFTQRIAQFRALINSK
jgi:hypothetical protein